MKLTKPIKMIIGVFTLLQIIGSIAFIFKIISTFTSIAAEGNLDDPDALGSMMSVMGGATALSFLGLVLLVFYIVHVAMNKTITGGLKAMWIILFLFIGLFSMPIYFFLQIWKDVEAADDPGNWDGETV